jgi:hypothetical protein
MPALIALALASIATLFFHYVMKARGKIAVGAGGLLFIAVFSCLLLWGGAPDF